jgi:transposase
MNPLFIGDFLGDENDKTVLPEMLTLFRGQAQFYEPLYCILDSAFYTENTIKIISDDVFYITLVPGNVKEQQELLMQDLSFTPKADPRYSYYET